MARNSKAVSFVNRGQIRLLNSKTTYFDWYYSRPKQKLKFLVRDCLWETRSHSSRMHTAHLLPYLPACNALEGLLGGAWSRGVPGPGGYIVPGVVSAPGRGVPPSGPGGTKFPTEEEKRWNQLRLSFSLSVAR